MPFKPVILWTDALVLLLVAVVIVSTWYIRGQEHLRAPWRKVTRSRFGMCSLVVLSVFVAIGLLDSLHYRPRLEARSPEGKPAYAVEVKSVFDALVAPLGKRFEAYSAPIRGLLLLKETIEKPDGTQVRRFRASSTAVRISKTRRDLLPDVLRGLVGAIGVAAVLWIVLTMLVAAWLAGLYKSDLSHTLSAIIHGETEVPWRAMLLTVGVLLAVAVPLALLSSRYHVMGTDKVGQDVFYEVLKRIRTGLIIGTLTTHVPRAFSVRPGTSAAGWTMSSGIYTL
jgi:peptide/nickel transport system permease protein